MFWLVLSLLHVMQWFKPHHAAAADGLSTSCSTEDSGQPPSSQMAICRASSRTYHCGSHKDISDGHKLPYSHMPEACSPIAPQQLGTAQLSIAVDYFLP